MKYTNPDPFNHGTTSITYIPVTAAEVEDLSFVVKHGWNIDIDSIHKLSAGTDKNSNNFRVDSSSSSYVLKWSHIDDPPVRRLVNEVIAYSGIKGIKISPPIPTVSDRNSFFGNHKGLFCLYDFIQGEHFDGSRAELVNVAEEAAYLHKALEAMPTSTKQDVLRLKKQLVKHDRKLLERILQTINSLEEKTDLDLKIITDIDEINEYSKQVSASDLDALPLQVIHHDLHPHNVLFDSHSKKVLALLDFDPIRYSQKVRDVSFAMHRFARTYGEHTERKLDTKSAMPERAQDFLNTYVTINSLSDKEIKALPLAIQDDALHRIINILNQLYINKDPSWSFDLSKQLTILREGYLFSF